MTPDQTGIIGAAPEVAMFEDHIFGQIKVSIAEKINESARGTARNAGVRARTESLLAAERRRLKRPGLVCPLHVSVAQPLSMPVAADVSLAVRRCLAVGDLEAAETVLTVVVREFVGRLASQDASDDRGDIYNGGAAISEDALKGFIEARGGDFEFLRREVQAADLAPALQEKFVFPNPSLRLVMAVSSEGQSLQHLFVFVGRALFRGLELYGIFTRQGTGLVIPFIDTTGVAADLIEVPLSASRTSVQVSSSRNTVSGAWARAAGASVATTAHITLIPSRTRINPIISRNH